jgi:hypothetical protein
VAMIVRGGLAAAAAAVALLSLMRASDAQSDGQAQSRPPACEAVKSEAECKARPDCHWVPPAMTFQPRPGHCRTKPKGSPGVITN